MLILSRDCPDQIVAAPSVSSLAEPAAPPAEDVGSDKSRAHGWISKRLTTQCGLGYSWPVRYISLVSLLLLSWVMLIVLAGPEALPGGGLFKLLFLFLLAQLVGEVFELARLPTILGMLLTGVALRTLGVYECESPYMSLVGVLRQLSLGIILIKAGLELDPGALLELSFSVIRLALCPGAVEAIAMAVGTHYILGYPWMWAFALGFLLCSTSPAIVVPISLGLKKQGYGEDKGISTLLIAASSIDDVMAISIFSICTATIFSKGDDVVMQILQGPMDVLAGLVVGALWGMLSSLTPHLQDKYLVWKRVVMLGGAGLCAILASGHVGFPGAGPLACITAAFVASFAWNLQGCMHNPVDVVFSKMWSVMQPVLFSLIGAEIDLLELDLHIVIWGSLIITGALAVRIFTCSIILIGGKLNFKEIVYVSLAWLPKATVQAALAPELRDMVQNMAHPQPADVERGSQFLTIAVLSILMTAPLGSIGPKVAGPRLLARMSGPAQDHHASTRTVNTVLEEHRL